jgi:hypothetical protein
MRDENDPVARGAHHLAVGFRGVLERKKRGLLDREWLEVAALEPRHEVAQNISGFD